MPTHEDRISALETLFAFEPSREWPVDLLRAVADKGRAATAQLEMTFEPWEVRDLGGIDGQVNVTRQSVKLSANGRPGFFFRAVDSVYGAGVHCCMHRKCSRAEFDALLPTIQTVVDAAWTVMGARLLDEPVEK